MDPQKIKSLKNMKMLASFFLLLAGVTLYLSFIFHLAWLRAISEAALVGGIADWFAIVALFKHPLRIPIPHTAIIPKSKDNIAKNIGYFVKNEFFNKENLRKSEFLKSIKLKTILKNFINGKNPSFSLTALTQALESKIPNLCEKIKNEEKNLRFLEQVNFSKIIGSTLQSLQNSPHYDEIVEELIKGLDQFFQSHKDELKDKLVGSSWLKRALSFVTSYDETIINEIEERINALKDPHSQERKKIKQYLKQGIDQLLNDEKTITKINSKIQGILGSDASVKILTAIMEHIQERKIISTTLTEIIKKEFEKFINDDIKLNATERWLKNKIVNIVSDYSNEIATFIQNTIQSWNSQEISEKLELEIGKDLQYIRINGTIVGGIIGGAIYGIETLFLSL